MWIEKGKSSTDHYLSFVCHSLNTILDELSSCINAGLEKTQWQIFQQFPPLPLMIESMEIGTGALLCNSQHHREK